MEFDFDFVDEVMDGELSLVMDCYQVDDHEPEFMAVQLG